MYNQNNNQSIPLGRHQKGKYFQENLILNFMVTRLHGCMVQSVFFFLFFLFFENEHRIYIEMLKLLQAGRAHCQKHQSGILSIKGQNKIHSYTGI